MMHFSLSCAKGRFGKPLTSVRIWPNSAVCLPERIIPTYAATEWRARSLGPRAGRYCAISKTSGEKPSPAIGDEPFLLPYQITSVICPVVGPLKAAPCISEVAEWS